MIGYAWWLAVGALVGVGVAGLLSIGAPLLLLAGVLALIGSRMAALRNRSVLAIPAGVGFAALFLAWLNRSGPGEVCETTATEMRCSEQWSPWPFVAIAVLLVTVSVVLARSR